MPYEIELKQQPAQPALIVCAHAAAQELPTLLPKSYGAIMQYLAELGEQPAGMPFAGYHNMDPQGFDVEVGFPVARPLPARGEIECGEFPGGELVTTMHVGPYEALAGAYDALQQWMNEHRYQPAGPVYELYYSEPGTPPDQIRTQIIWPVKKI